jgi:hypothetical protein
VAGFLDLILITNLNMPILNLYFSNIFLFDPVAQLMTHWLNQLPSDPTPRRDPSVITMFPREKIMKRREIM